MQASSAGWSWVALLACASHEPIHHFAVTSRAARIDASSQILAPDGSPPRPPVLVVPPRGTHRYRNRAPLAREMAASRRKMLSNTGSVHRPFSHANTTPMLLHNISTTRPLVMHLRAARLALKYMARASFRCIGSLYVYRPLLSNCHDEGASNDGSISGKSGSIAQWPSRSDCSLLLFKARLLAGCPSVHLKRHLSFHAQPLAKAHPKRELPIPAGTRQSNTPVAGPGMTNRRRRAPTTR